MSTSPNDSDFATPASKFAAPDDRGGLMRTLARSPEWGLVAGLIFVLLIIYALDPQKTDPQGNTTGAAFFRSDSQRYMFHQVARFGVLAVGATIVIIAGGIDLSVGAVVALASVVSAKLITEWLPGATPKGPPSVALVTGAISLTLLLGLAVGLLHSLMINIFRLPPFIATLATMAGLRSVASLASNNRSINVPFEAYRMWGRDPFYTLPLFFLVAVIAAIMMGSTVLGRHLYALGGNEAAARLSGLPTRRLKTIAYGISGMLSALGGILFTGQSGQGQSTMGVSYELYAITAAVVGGCSLSGGVGSIKGTVLGLILIQVVIKGTGLVVRGVDSTQIEGLVLGTVVVLAVAFNQRFRVQRS